MREDKRMPILDKILGGMNFADLERQVEAFFRHAEQLTAQVNLLRQQVATLHTEQAALRGQVSSIQSSLLRIEQCLNYNLLPSPSSPNQPKFPQ